MILKRLFWKKVSPGQLRGNRSITAEVILSNAVTTLAIKRGTGSL